MKNKKNSGKKSTAKKNSTKKSTSKKVTVRRKALTVTRTGSLVESADITKFTTIAEKVEDKGHIRDISDDGTEAYLVSSIKPKSIGRRFLEWLSAIFNIQILPKDSKVGFKFLEGINRPITPAQVTKLAESIRKMGIVRPVVVADLDFNGLFGTYIIDGQHLYFALMRSNLDIPYIKITITSAQELVEMTALLNSSSKPWQLKDYIQVWSFIRPDYKKLSHYFNQYDLEVQTVAAILNNRTASGGGINANIKNGTFVVKNEQKAVKTLDLVTEVLKCVPRMDRMSNKFFVGAYVEFLTQAGSSYDHAKFCNYLKQNKQKLTFVNGDKDNIFSFFNECL